MKISILVSRTLCHLVMAFLLLSLLLAADSARHVQHEAYNEADKEARTSHEMVAQGSVGTVRKAADTLQIAGSSLPDCSHACGSCRPCRLVVVSYVCSALEEAETCPMAYKCMCNNKSYPVP